MASQSSDRRQNLLKSCVKELQQCVEYVKKYSENTDQHLDMLRDVTKEYCEIDIEHVRAQTACEATDNHFDNQENDCTEDVQQIYNKYLEEQPSSANYTNHSIWRSINNTINASDKNPVQEDSNDEDSANELEEDDNRSIDEEGIIPSQFEPPVDPITKKLVENPCRNRKCGHIYEFSTIMDHLKRIKQNKVKPRCPYIGCTNMNMRSSFIVKDDNLKEQIQVFVATQGEDSEQTQSSIYDLDM